MPQFPSQYPHGEGDDKEDHEPLVSPFCRVGRLLRRWATWCIYCKTQSVSTEGSDDLALLSAIKRSGWFLIRNDGVFHAVCQHCEANPRNLWGQTSIRDALRRPGRED